MTLYGISQWIVRTAARIGLPAFRVRGREHVPTDGPFLLVANHQSILDPLLIQAVCPRPLHTMTKSTQFAAPGMAWYLTRVHAFPVRRYQIDPQAVRVALRRLAQGHGVGVYIEGERSWDGRLQPPRLGTIRLALKAGVPIIPCAIAGAYDVWPRWDRRLRRAPIAITFGTPIRLPQLDDRAARDAVLDETGDRLMRAIESLLADRATDVRVPAS